MPDISNLRRKQAPAQPPVPEDVDSSDTSSSEEEQDAQPLVIPDACLACGKEKVTHLTVPCRHPCLCRACAMKMATGGKCKVRSKTPSLIKTSFWLVADVGQVCQRMFVELKRLPEVVAAEGRGMGAVV
jgi:hypothetical protein